MPLDESRAADETGHIADHNTLHDFHNRLEAQTGPWLVVTQAAYDALTPDAGTLYVIVG